MLATEPRSSLQDLVWSVAGDARDLVDDDSLLQRIMKLCLFPECPVIASSLDKGSELFDATGLLTRPS